MKSKITLKSVNTKLQGLMREIKELRNTMFKWGQQNMKDIDSFKKMLAEKQLKELENDK